MLETEIETKTESTILASSGRDRNFGLEVEVKTKNTKYFTIYRKIIVSLS